MAWQLGDPMTFALLMLVWGAIGVGLQMVMAKAGERERSSMSSQKLHLRRKLQHAASGVFIIASKVFAGTRGQACALMLAVCAAGLVLHVTRKRVKAVDRWYMQQFGPVLRPRERHALPGAFWFLLGCTAVIWWFPQPVALCAIVCLSFGDPAASLAGAIFHRRSPRIPLTRDKTVAGALGAIVASSASVAVFLGVYPHMGHASLGVVEYVCFIIACGVAAGVGEAIPLWVDDNLSMPVVTGSLILLLAEVMHLPLSESQVLISY